MDPNPYSDVGKSAQSFYGALSGSLYFPMSFIHPNYSYPFVPAAPLLPMHHTMLSGHGPQDSHMLSGGDQMAKNNEEMSSRAMTAFFQSRYPSLNKCFLNPAKKSISGSKFCSSLMDVQSSNDKLYGESVVGLTNNGDKECYLSSPGTEVEEPDSSGKCSTDITEQKVITRWNCDSSQPPVCPICTRTISLPDLLDHYHMELDKLNELMRKRDWIGPEDEQMNPQRFQPYHDVEKRCPEFRKETYLRVRANRINRLGGSRTKRQCFEDSWKMQRIGPLLSPKQENVQEENSAHQSMLMLELTDQIKASLADSSSCNNSENVSSCPGDIKQQASDDDNQCSSGDIKCQVCLEPYKKPVVSVLCWHVHCEVCWLKALGNKRVCPQCETITSPGDLRRIHL